MNNGLSREGARHSASRLAAIAFTIALMASAGALLSSCGHEPEKATPPANTETTASSNSSNASKADSDDTQKADADKEAADKTADEQKAKEEQEAKSKHQGAYVTAIRNGGGVDGLAAAAQAKLVAAGLAEDTHTYSLDSYTNGLAPTTVVYVKGTGDDAADVKAEAEKVVAALGAGSVQTFDQTAAGESMDAIDILVIVGQDAAATLQ